MNFNWVAAGVILAAIVALGAFLRWQIPLLFKAELADFKTVTDAAYVPREGSHVTGADLDRRLELVEQRLFRRGV